MKILVLGAFVEEDKACQDFLKHLAKEIADGNHQLLNGCRNELDEMLARQLTEQLQAQGKNPSDFIISYVAPDKPPVHEFGKIFKSRVKSWSSLASVGLEVPETIEMADVILVISGHEGTICAANWARIARKPLLPVANFGGAARDIFYEEIDQFEVRNHTYLQKQDFELLNQYASDLSRLAKDAISLASRAIISKEVFIIMSFSNDPLWNDVADSFQTVCEECGFKAVRVDESTDGHRIIPEIFSSIEEAAFVIADISEHKPNVFYELGYAQGLKKDVIVTARKGTELPFDLADVPTLFWEGQKQLKDALREKVQRLASRHGRC